VIALALALVLSTAPAREVPKDPLSSALYEQLSRGLPAAGVGQWVTYMLRGSANRYGFWRLSIVGKTKDAKGRDAVWLEMEMGQNPNFVAPLFQMKMLVASEGGLQADGISRAVLAIGAGQPQEVDPKSLAPKEAAAKPAPRARTAPYRGAQISFRAGKRQKLMTAAGSVDALPVELVYRQTVIQRYWVSKEIPVLQLAKIEIPGIDDSLEVRDYGLNAKPLIHFPDPDAPKISLEAPEADGGTP
jgi:hypothetical protein